MSRKLEPLERCVLTVFLAWTRIEAVSTDVTKASSPTRTCTCDFVTSCMVATIRRCCSDSPFTEERTIRDSHDSMNPSKRKSGHQGDSVPHIWSGVVLNTVFDSGLHVYYDTLGLCWDS
ncbi:hypothetical protein FB446DRAFT_172077 [Lentinula raphanica]|nr:hypothetical protein FB446DRAFT_172077 [Lentinula raphanica]